MKITITLSLFIALLSSASAQILTRSENWPNSNWSVGGAVYTPAALIFNPKTDDKFKYDATLVNPPGSPSSLYAASPTFDLKPAFDGGETAFKIDFSISYGATADGELMVQYWNADTNTWVTMPDGMAPIGELGTISTCTNFPVNLFFNFSNFTTNQLQNFSYRFSLNDAGSQLAGICINSPTLNSLSCSLPTNLDVINISAYNASLDWTGNGGSDFQIEYGVHGFSLGTGNHQQVNFHPFQIGGLNPLTTYDFYVQEDCSKNQTVVSNWAGPKSFTTSSLGLEDHTLKGFKLYPNPIKNTLWLDSEKILSEVKIFNLSGQELMNIKPSKSHISIDLSELNMGLYFLKVTTDEGLGSYKIMKN